MLARNEGWRKLVWLVMSCAYRKIVPCGEMVAEQRVAILGAECARADQATCSFRMISEPLVHYRGGICLTETGILPCLENQDTFDRLILCDLHCR